MFLSLRSLSCLVLSFPKLSSTPRSPLSSLSSQSLPFAFDSCAVDPLSTIVHTNSHSWKEGALTRTLTWRGRDPVNGSALTQALKCMAGTMCQCICGSLAIHTFVFFFFPSLSSFMLYHFTLRCVYIYVHWRTYLSPPKTHIKEEMRWTLPQK